MSAQTIISLFRSVDGCDWDHLADHFDPEVVYERPGFEPCHGLEELVHFYREVRVIAGGSHELEHVVADGERGACWGRFVGIHRNGSPIDVLFADVYTFRAGKIRTRRSHFFAPSI